MSERLLTIPGTVNLRDFGGYATQDGRWVSLGRLFRSGSLANLTDEGRSQFSQLKIRLICDLRRHDEKQDEPTALPLDDPQRLEIPIDPGSAIEMRAKLADTDLTLNERIDFMVAINRELARDHVEDYARMFEGLLDLEQGGFLVHCAAGKDRTGFAVALILHALGVPERVVMDDYLLTNQAMDFENYLIPRLRQRYGDRHFDRDSVMALAGVRPEYLSAAYAAIHEEFAGVEHYIEQAIGLSELKRERLRNRLLVARG